MSGAIGLMCKPPRISKTRLAAVIGAERAAVLAHAFLADSAALAQEIARREHATAVAFHTPADTAAEMAALLPEWTLHPQAEGDLGYRMERAADHLFARGAGQVLLLGTDAPTLPPALLELVLAALRSGDDAACVPALDGGYCAMAFARPLPALLRGMPWSTPELLAATRGRAKAEGLKLRELQFWHDVDQAEDLKLLRMSLDGQQPPNCSPLVPFPASATRAAIG